MKITREDLPQREVVLSIEVEDSDLEPYLDRAYRRVVQKVNVPGFRKGKAPRLVVERFVGKEALADEAVELMVPEAVEKAVAQEGLEQGSPPKVEVTQQKPVVLKATVPLVPKVVLEAYRDIRVPPEPLVVGEEQVDAVLGQLRWDAAPWEPADRPLAMGDQVTLDVHAKVEGEVVINQKGVVYLVRDTNLGPAPGFAQALVGLKPDENKSFELPFPANHTNQRLAGKDCTFQVTAHEVKEKRLPELDDEFAKGVGQGYDTFDALKSKVREDIRTQAEQAARAKYEDEVAKKLVERTKIELSPLMVGHEVEHLLHDEEEALRSQRVGMEQYLRAVGKGADEHRAEVRITAVERLTRTFAIRQVAELEGLAATAEEVEAELKSLSDGVGSQGERLRRSLDTPDGRDSMKQMILRRKAVDRLVEIAKGLRDS